MPNTIKEAIRDLDEAVTNKGYAQTVWEENMLRAIGRALLVVLQKLEAEGADDE